MKVFVGIEHAFHRARSDLYARLNKFDSFRKKTLRRLGPETIAVTLQAGDHVITFCPHEVVGKLIYRHGHFNRDLTQRALSIAESEGVLAGRTVVEIGANIGTQSLYLMLSGFFDRIVCIEPEPRNLRLLRRNLADNDLAEKAIILEYAVGDVNGEAEFHIDDVNHGASSFTRTTGSERSITVPVRRVDDLLAEARVDLNQIGLVWMDIEGAEPEALRSMEPLIAQSVPLMIEFSPSIYGEEKADALIRYLADRYDRCIVFIGDDEYQLAVADVPRNRSCDILLLS